MMPYQQHRLIFNSRHNNNDNTNFVDASPLDVEITMLETSAKNHTYVKM